MVNCNPETVSTDYDTSDRLYFEPLDTESVLAVCEREQPDGVVIQFGGQTPLKLARAIEDAGYRILGTPFDAVDLAEDRERFAGLLRAHGLRSPEWGIAASPDEAVAIAERIGYPVLVRPSYVLGGRAMRVCYTPDEVREMPPFEPDPRRPLRRARGRGRRRRALRRRGHLHRRGHAARRGGRRPLRRLVVRPARAEPHLRAERRRSRTSSGSSGARSASVGLLNVQLAVTADATSTSSRRTRARRARCRSSARRSGSSSSRPPAGSRSGRRSAELGLPPERPPRQWSVKAAVLPFARFPGSDPVLGPEMRSTGEVMASAADLSTALDKAERAAGRRLPRSGTVFISVRDPDHQQAVPIAATLAGLGFELYRDRGHGGHARGRGHRGRGGAEGQRGDRRRADGRRPHPPRPLRPRRSTRRRAATRAPTATRSARRRSRARAVHHDALRRRRRRARDRERARRAGRSRSRSGSMQSSARPAA